MGTFHNGRSDLHGITVVVETRNAHVWIGRCDDMDEGEVVLLDADVHEDVRSREEFVRQAARVGHWSRHPRVVIPRSEVVSVRRLGEVAQR